MASSTSDFDDDYFPDFERDAPPEAPVDTGHPLPFSLDGIDLLSPPGFVGRVADWIDGQCRYQRRRLAVASAIVSIGNIGGLRHEDARDGVTANMLAFCVAASATGKEAVQQAMAKLHITAGVHYALQGGIKSEQEIMRNLIEHQAAYYIVDEIGIFLTKVRSAQKRGGAAYLEGVFGAIMSGYSKANSRLLLQGDTKRDLRKVFGQAVSKAQDAGDFAAEDRAIRMLNMIDEGLERPFLSIMGFTTPSTFDQVMDGEAATQGFVGRALIVSEPDLNPSPRKGFKPLDMPMQLQMRLTSLYAGPFSDGGSGRIEFLADRSVIKTTPEADLMLDQVSDWLIEYAALSAQETGEASVALVRRAYEMVAKVSFILGLADGQRTAEHVRWAFAYVRAEVDAKIKLVFANDNAKDKPTEALAARIINLIGHEGATVNVLANRTRKPASEIERVLDLLKSQGLVSCELSDRKYRGKRPMVWKALDV